MFADDLQAIDRLRTDAINVHEPHASGVKRLQAYAAQLRWIGGKFPIDVRHLDASPHLELEEADTTFTDWCGLSVVSSARLRHRKTR